MKKNIHKEKDLCDYPYYKWDFTKILRIMRLTAFLLFITCLQVTAEGYSQKVTLTEKNVSLQNVFKKIQKQSGYDFFYENRLLSQAGTIDIEVKNVSLEQALDACLKGQSLSWSIVGKIIVIKQKLISQLPALLDIEVAPPIIITGKVTNVHGESLPGVSILIKGTNKGVVTEVNGTFKIQVSEKDKFLLFSSLGMKKQEVEIKGRTVINVVMEEELSQIKQVVVMGYYNQKKESFTGNAITVSGEDLRRIGTQNLLQNIQVIDPSFKQVVNNEFGSDPNKLPEFQVRGTTALGSTSSSISDPLDKRTLTQNNPNLPTFILDGYQVSLEKVYDLDINRVESVTLLKDAAATAIYGSRASNGVLVIKTKEPQEGKLMFSYNFETTMSLPDLSVYHLLNAKQKLDYEVLAGLYIPTVNISEDVQIANYTKKREFLAAGVNTDWLSQSVRNAFGQKHAVYIEGGSKAIRYGLDLRYQTSPGVMKGSGRDRLGVGMNLSYNLSDKILFKNYLSVENVKVTNSPYGSFSTYAKANPYYPIRDSAGNYNREMEIWNLQQSSGAVLTSAVLNPLYNSTLNSFDKSEYLNLTDQFSFEWTIARGLRLRSMLSYSTNKSSSDVFTSPFDNMYYDYQPVDYIKRGSYLYSTGLANNFDGSTVLTYGAGFREHYINFALGTNITTSSTDNRGIRAIGFTNDKFTELGFANAYAVGDSPVGQFLKSRLFGSFSSVNYSYANKYLFDFSFRLDGSSKFGSKNKYAPFWSTGIGWNMHKEKFLQNTVISQLKLRATTGFLGEVSFDPFMANTIYQYYTNNWYSTGVGAGFIGYGNELLKWQRTQTTDMGLDLGLFEDRIWISGRYYLKTTKDLLADINVAPSLGFSSYKSNLGELENKGYEFNVKLDFLKGSKDWRVTLTGNIAHNENKILKISEALKAYNQNLFTSDPYNFTRPIPQYIEGQSLTQIYAVKSLGIDKQTGMEVLVKRDGTLTYTYDPKDMVPCAERAPKAEGYLGATVSYKDFVLTTNMHYKFGGYLFNQTLVDMVENADPRYNVDIRALEERWKNPGDATFYKSIASTSLTRATSRFIQKDNEFGITSLNLTYELPKTYAKKISMESIRFGANLWDVWRWSSVNIERGTDYPFAKTVTFSIITKF
ncbi:MAG: SusC/RagA family TonB-linked outer membrane protein [Bacteroidetes bacterium]|nr:SusC/RagA family TonB-linked outer membrane protein [Bacteroidota bacterium]